MEKNQTKAPKQTEQKPNKKQNNQIKHEQTNQQTM